MIYQPRRPIPSTPPHTTRGTRPRPQVTQPIPPRIRRTFTLPTSTMCKVHYYREVHPDGRTHSFSNKELCPRSRHGVVCDRATEFKHPTEHIGAHLSPRLRQDAYPPTPPRSSHSGSDTERSSNKRASGNYNGAKVIEVNPRPSSRHRNERVVYVDESPLSRTPPRHSSSPYSSPSSPNRLSFDGYERRRRDSVIEAGLSRPSVKIEIVNDRPEHKKHHRRNSSKASSRDSSEEAQLRQRRLNDMFSRDEERIQSKIARANEAISSRPAIPSAPQAPAPKYRRGSVVFNQSRPDSLSANFNRLSVNSQEAWHAEEKARRRAEQQEAEVREYEEQEAQKRRLKDRMSLPNRRRESVNYGSARPPAMYDDGRYKREY